MLQSLRLATGTAERQLRGSSAGRRGLGRRRFRLQFRPPDGPEAAAEAVRLRGAADAAPRAGRPWPDAARPGAAARRRDAVASAFSSLIWKALDEGAVGAESRRSLHLVVCRVPYFMSRDRCRPLLCAEADSNRRRSALAFPGAIGDRVDCSFSGCCRPGARPTATLRAHHRYSASEFAQFAACSATSSSRRSRASSSTVRRSWATSTVAVILISRSE